MEVIDEQIRNACKEFGLNPAGHVPVRYGEFGFESDDRAEWSGDDCWEIVCAMADGDEFPEAGPLGFAAGHPSPGWKFLRDLCDQVAAEHIDTDWFAAMSYDQAQDHLQEHAEDRARMETWMHALVCVADLEVDEHTEGAAVLLGEAAVGTSGPRVSSMAWDLLGHAGYLVLREVFAPQIDSKNKE